MNSVERVKAICSERKIAISKLEKDLGFGNGYIGQLRKGVFPADRLAKIADYLNVTTDYLLTGAETKKRPPPHPETSLKKPLLLGEMERKLNGLIQKIKWTRSEKSLMLCHLSTTKRYLMVR